MKMEKLTENKILFIFNTEDLKDSNTDLHTLMTKAIESQSIFYELLAKAEKELDFHTEGCKLLIEAFCSADGLLIFIITKYSTNPSTTTNSENFSKSKRLVVKRKPIFPINKNIICKFSTFEEFCDLCYYINELQDFDIKKVSKNISLYFYRNTYYLQIQNINNNYNYTKKFFSIISEFSKIVSYSENFRQ